MAGGSPESGSRSRARAEAAVVTLPRARRGSDRLELGRLAPSGRSLAVGFALLAAAAGAYALARGTSAFAVQEIAVEGAPTHVAAQVRRALASARGESLLSLDLARLQVVVEDVPTVAAVRFDRAFPHTLSVAVVPERPVVVLRRGADSWLAAASGRVVAELDRGDRARLPRIWLRRSVDVRLGETLTGDLRRAVRAVAPLTRRPLPAHVSSVRSGPHELTLVLRSGVEVRLGDDSDRALKLELARRILPLLGAEMGYLDLSVPLRPVAGPTLESEVEVETTTSTTP